MNKLLLSLGISIMLLFGQCAFAEGSATPVLMKDGAVSEPAEIPTPTDTVQPAANTLTEVNVILYLNNNYRFTSSNYAVFSLSDGTSTYERIVPVASSREALGMTFDVAPYEIGKTFTLTMVSGIDRVLYYNTPYSAGQPMTLYTYSYVDAYGSVQMSNTTYMEYIPVQSDKLSVIYNGSNISSSVPAMMLDGCIMVAIEPFARATGIPTVKYDHNYNSYVLKNDSVELLLNIDSVYTTLSGVSFNAPTAPRFVNGVAYGPLSVIGTAFDLSVNIEQTDAGYNLNVIRKQSESAPEPTVTKTSNNNFVNSSGLSSSTDYLIWVSKKDFTVKVYLGSKGKWEEVNSFTCAIGASATPTCEGTYKYYEFVPKWDYGSYYVGPILRFNGGYALHSTLINADGSLRDNRVGVKISHGCVRLKPEDINWLAYYIPLQTTVHVTA